MDNYRWAFPWPNNTKPEDFLNNGNRCTFFSLSSDTAPIFAVIQLVGLLYKFSTKTIIKIEADIEVITEELKSSSIANRVCYLKVLYI